jgi:hypothetical protein
MEFERLEELSDRLEGVGDVAERRFPHGTEVGARAVVVGVPRTGLALVTVERVALADVGTVIAFEPDVVGVLAVGQGDDPVVPRRPFDQRSPRIGATPRGGSVVALGSEIERRHRFPPPLQSGQVRRGMPPREVVVTRRAPQVGQCRLMGGTLPPSGQDSLRGRRVGSTGRSSSRQRAGSGR